MKPWPTFSVALLLFLMPAVLLAGEADVVNATVTQTSHGTYRFNVTVEHADTGWGHYADAWEVRAPDGTVLGTRVLFHPHVDEQPFTRSLSDVKIPSGVAHVIIYAHDSVHGWGGKAVTIALTDAK
jgi:uncharacterized protein YceK